MPQAEAKLPSQLTAFDKLYALPVTKLKEGRALLLDRFDEEVNTWAYCVENNDQEGTLAHWRAALVISEHLKTVTWIIGIKTYTGD
jgi:hypothetical protein